jgi:predicted secreted protein
MNNQRRNVLKIGSGAALLSVLAAAGIITPGMALADWNKAAFDAKSMADTLKAIGAGTPTDSKDVQVTGPDIAENGAVVPVGVSSTLPNVTMVAILIEKEPERAVGCLQCCRKAPKPMSRPASKWVRPPMSTHWSSRMASSSWRPRKSRSPWAAAAANRSRHLLN